jgi:phosphoribosyl-AMP cyclohydrolase
MWIILDRMDVRNSSQPVTAGQAARCIPQKSRTEEFEGVAEPENLDPLIAARLRRNSDGLIAAVVRQYDTGEVLMLAWMDDEALHRTLTTGRATYWSRSRREYWVKGETSGHHQYVRSVALDCDGDAVLVSVDQVGPACHTGTRTCFTDELAVAGDACEREE